MIVLEFFFMIWKENVLLLVIFSLYFGFELGLCGVIFMFNGIVYLFFDGMLIYNREKIYFSVCIFFFYLVLFWYIYICMYIFLINKMKKLS